MCGQETIALKSLTETRLFYPSENYVINNTYLELGPLYFDIVSPKGYDDCTVLQILLYSDNLCAKTFVETEYPLFSWLS